MDILENLNKRLALADDDFSSGGEEEIEQVLQKSPVKLPEDYIAFLKSISGNESAGVEFIVNDDEEDAGGCSIYICSAGAALDMYEEFDNPDYEDVMDQIWFVGNDLGDLYYFYAEGNDGCGLYRDEAGSLNLDEAEKIADTITDFLVNGTGIDVAISL